MLHLYKALQLKMCYCCKLHFVLKFLIKLIRGTHLNLNNLKAFFSLYDSTVGLYEVLTLISSELHTSCSDFYSIAARYSNGFSILCWLSFQIASSQYEIEWFWRLLLSSEIFYCTINVFKNWAKESWSLSMSCWLCPSVIVLDVELNLSLMYKF